MKVVQNCGVEADWDKVCTVAVLEIMAEWYFSLMRVSRRMPDEEANLMARLKSSGGDAEEILLGPIQLQHHRA